MRYKELVFQDPEAETRRFFESCDIPVEHVSSALSALKRDSQKGEFGDRGDNEKLLIDEAGWRKYDAALAKMDIGMDTNIEYAHFEDLFKDLF